MVLVQSKKLISLPPSLPPSLPYLLISETRPDVVILGDHALIRPQDDLGPVLVDLGREGGREGRGEGGVK